jgi:CRP/FNR family transcriptional regulator, nitrogen fixation regulation protein
LGPSVPATRIIDCKTDDARQAGVTCTSVTYERGEEIYGESDPAENWYRLETGAARKCALLSDGRRCIVDFLFPSDYFGFRMRHCNSFAVEAIVPGTKVARYSRRHLETAADRDPRISHEIREIAFEAISRSQGRLLILGRVTAIEKVGAFLLEMMTRCSGHNRRVVNLPMSRYDIADYLTISVETVSRALTELKNSGAIQLNSNRCFQLLDCEMLENGLDRTSKSGALASVGHKRLKYIGWTVGSQGPTSSKSKTNF